MKSQGIKAGFPQLPSTTLLASLERLIDERVEWKLKALGIGERMPSRADLRVAAGFLSLQDCEITAQLPRGTLSQYESGRVHHLGSRNRATLDRLCALLGVSPAEYCRARPEKPGLSG